MTTSSPSEKRLEELREQAWKDGVVPGKGVDVAGGPIPRKPGYYGQPVVKPPVWTWEVPLYFFFGGLAGMSAVIASGARHSTPATLSTSAFAFMIVLLSPRAWDVTDGRATSVRGPISRAAIARTVVPSVSISRAVRA